MRRGGEGETKGRTAPREVHKGDKGPPAGVGGLEFRMEVADPQQLGMFTEGELMSVGML